MDEKKRQVWRFVIQTAISILTAIATARPQQNRGTRQFADGCPLSYLLICLRDFPSAS